MLPSWVNVVKRLVFVLSLYALCFSMYCLIWSTLIRPPQLTNPVSKQNEKSKVCRDVFEILFPNPNSSSELVKTAVEVIREAKERKDFLLGEAYAALGYEGLSTVHEEKPFHGINGSNITIPHKTLLDKLNWEMPYLPCKLKKYEAEDVKLCVEKRLALGLQTRIAYIGDSKMRQQMEVLLDFLHSFNLNISTSEEEFISLDDFLGLKGTSEWTKYKDRLSVTCKDLPGLSIKFIWAPNLPKGNKEYTSSNPFIRRIRKQKISSLATSSKLSAKTKNYTQNYNVGALSALRHMASISQEEVDDLILLSGGTWQLRSGENIIDNIDKEVVYGMQKLSPVLASLAARTSVVMMLPEPFKEYTFNSKGDAHNYFLLQKNENIQWYLNAQAQLLPSSVQIWDTFVPAAYGAITDCFELLSNTQINISSLPAYSRFKSIESYGCYERIHVGFRNIYTSVQQLLNHLCNRVMTENVKGFCCSE